MPRFRKVYLKKRQNHIDEIFRHKKMLQLIPMRALLGLFHQRGLKNKSHQKGH